MSESKENDENKNKENSELSNKLKDNLIYLFDYNINFIIGSGISSLFKKEITTADLENKKDFFKNKKVDEGLIDLEKIKKNLSINEDESIIKEYYEFLLRDIQYILENSNGKTKGKNDEFSLNQINILTPNYDNFIEQVILKECSNFIRLNKFSEDKKFVNFNKMEIDLNTNLATPTINLFKPHGDIENIKKTDGYGFWINSVDKNTISNFNSFEEIRIFRNNLLNNENSILFVIGYGYNDQYINNIIEDSLNNKWNINILFLWSDKFENESSKHDKKEFLKEKNLYRNLKGTDITILKKLEKNKKIFEGVWERINEPKN
ncbi:MAG: hypothetical protein TYPL_3800 [Candidatus Tyloplasma litorale]|nr:MAG: hypothetical protein TYPL_3800 [Mycoplasmatales bacterium]